jgi:hypothetical protein
VGAANNDGKINVFLPKEWHTLDSRVCCTVARALGALGAATTGTSCEYLCGLLSTLQGFPRGNFSQVAAYYTNVATALKQIVAAEKVRCVETALRLLGEISTA